MVQLENTRAGTARAPPDGGQPHGTLPESRYLELRHPDLVVTFDDLLPIRPPDQSFSNSVVHDTPRGLELFNAIRERQPPQFDKGEILDQNHRKVVGGAA